MLNKRINFSTTGEIFHSRVPGFINDPVSVRLATLPWQPFRNEIRYEKGENNVRQNDRRRDRGGTRNVSEIVSLNQTFISGPLTFPFSILLFFEFSRCAILYTWNAIKPRKENGGELKRAHSLDNSERSRYHNPRRIYSRLM